TLPTFSDVDLLRQMMAGEEDAFAELYKRRQAGVYRFALQMSGSPEIAEDVTQEVFIVLMRTADRFDPNRGSLTGTWTELRETTFWDGLNRTARLFRLWIRAKRESLHLRRSRRAIRLTS